MDKSNLPEPQRWLVEQCQKLNFGKVTFRVRAGMPDLTVPQRITRTVKLVGGDNGARPEAVAINFALRQEFLALFAKLARLSDRASVTVKVMHGLPTSSIDVEDDQQAA